MRGARPVNPRVERTMQLGQPSESAHCRAMKRGHRFRWLQLAIAGIAAAPFGVQMSLLGMVPRRTKCPIGYRRTDATMKGQR